MRTKHLLTPLTRLSLSHTSLPYVTSCRNLHTLKATTTTPCLFTEPSNSFSHCSKPNFSRSSPSRPDRDACRSIAWRQQRRSVHVVKETAKDDPSPQPDNNAGKENKEDVSDQQAEENQSPRKPLEPWMIQKNALREKFNGEAWRPRKRVSPDALEGIRALHAQDPVQFSTPVLADKFKISKEAIRRILRSKWRPTEEEQEDRLERWNRRGESIWNDRAKKGLKPPKKWREAGVGGSRPGERSDRRRPTKYTKSETASSTANREPDTQALESFVVDRI